jgi:mono/diheme cytochrome c family protein
MTTGGFASLFLFLLVVVPAVVSPQTPRQDPAKQGAQIFAASCTGYCHAPAGGSGGGAPRLAGRGFDQAYITTTIANGVPATSMPGFSSTLSRADLTAVVAYVASLNGIGSGGTAAADPTPLSADAERGRQLFSDAVRSFERCSTCHEVDGIGIPVSTPMTKIPADVPALRRLATPQVVTATRAEDTMPVLVVSNTSRATIYYDLSTLPPVLRTAEPGTVKVASGGSWQHASVIGSYDDGALTAILTYLRGVVR